MKALAFFNDAGGVGKTTLLYHVAWMFSDLGVRTVAVDLDPQSTLTSMFLDEVRLDELWEGSGGNQTIGAALSTLIEKGAGDVQTPHLEKLAPNLALVPGELGLARMEDELSSQRPKALAGSSKAFRITSAFHRVVRLAAEEFEAELALLDVGPNLGALNRCALLAADCIAVPIVANLFSLQGLRDLGLTLRKWRLDWQQCLNEAPEGRGVLPNGSMTPIGYVVLQAAVRQSRPVRPHLRWANRIPPAYRKAMEHAPVTEEAGIETDPHCLAQLKHYRSLMPLAMEASKPIFHLKPADGAIGAHLAAVAECGQDFRRLVKRIADEIHLDLPRLS